jgi:replicative DNA helicase
MAVLGSMIIEREAVMKAFDIVDESDFYRDAHAKVFGVIKDLFVENNPVDSLSVIEALKKKNLFERVGGASFIANIMNNVSTAANVEHYARIVREKSILRHLINTGTRIVESAYKADGDPHVLLDKAEKEIMNVAVSRSGGFIHAGEIAQETIAMIEKLKSGGGSTTGLSTGFSELDQKTGGFQPANLIIIAGRPSMGKTSLCMNIAANTAIRGKRPVGFFSLEMSKKELMMRLICTESFVNYFDIKKGIYSSKQHISITSAAALIGNSELYIEESFNLTALDIRTHARRLDSELRAKNKKLAMIAVDYLQLVTSHGRSESRQQEVAEISRSLKSLAVELEIPVVVVSQLSRKTEEKGREGRPILSDLRESGAIEQDADLVLFIYREEYYKRNDPELQGKAKIIIAKQRNGPTDEFEMKFYREYTKFDNLSKVGQ